MPKKRPLLGAKPKTNPFEVIRPRRKFDVLGRRDRGGEEKRLTLSRSRGIEKRKNTLLVEYQKSSKSSQFVDKRLGEKDVSLSEYGKAILRLQREHMSKLKRTRKTSKYNLSDDELDDFGQGGAMLEKDDFEDEILLDGSDDEGKSDAPRHLSFGSSLPSSNIDLLEDEEQPRKSKKQVMSEIISKSKFYKAKKAEAKEQYERLLGELDKEAPMLPHSTNGTTESKVENDLSEQLDKDFIFHEDVLQSLMHPEKKHVLKSLSNTSSSIEKETPDDYSKLVKGLGMGARARPSERTKTAEEIAHEERERLEKLEEARRKRMVAASDSSDEETDADDDRRTKSAIIQSRSGDDLGDSFSVNEATTDKKGLVDVILEKEAADGSQDGGQSDENNDDSGTSSGDELSSGEGDDDDNNASDGEASSDEMGNMSAKDWEQSDDENVAIDEDNQASLSVKDHSKRKVKEDLQSLCREDSERAAKDNLETVPYVIESPKNFMELCSLLDNRSEVEVGELIKRIRVCNSIKLAAENRKKMQVFYAVLLQYFAALASKRPVKIELVNTLVQPLIEISGEIPYFAAICARQRLIHIRTRLCDDIKVSGRNCWPSLKTLLLLRLWSLIFPFSDFRHVVATPVLVLMNEYLIRCPVQSGRDAALGAFLCSMVLAVTKESRKFCPEAIMFLQTALMASSKSHGSGVCNPVHDQFVELKTRQPWLQICGEVKEVKCMDFYTVMETQEDSSYFSSDEFKASTLLSIAETLKGFVLIYEDLSSFPEIFSPVLGLLRSLSEKLKLPDLLSCAFQEVILLITETIDKCYALRQPLQMRKQKPEPIKLLNPQFEDKYVKGLDYDPDRERAKLKKLKKQLRNEKKGAIREIRKDNSFMYMVKERERLEQEQERAEKYGKSMAFLQEQEHAFKSGQLGKGRKRRP